ncbi:hypothetical protein LCGC14_1925330 [marine sediment metagenome]|uniref:Uncharacterized protein n=1 Tax=marine sediment metagenome TaxID=412755 RepID=A0A0F9IMF0_9ZZZZ
MIKTFGVIIGGIFIGAVGVEILRRKYPKALDKLYAQTCEIASEAKAAFKSGYDKAVGPADAA